MSLHYEKTITNELIDNTLDEVLLAQFKHVPNIKNEVDTSNTFTDSPSEIVIKSSTYPLVFKQYSELDETLRSQRSYIVKSKDGHIGYVCVICKHSYMYRDCYIDKFNNEGSSTIICPYCAKDNGKAYIKTVKVSQTKPQTDTYKSSVPKPPTDTYKSSVPKPQTLPTDINGSSEPNTIQLDGEKYGITKCKHKLTSQKIENYAYTCDTCLRKLEMTEFVYRCDDDDDIDICPDCSRIILSGGTPKVLVEYSFKRGYKYARKTYRKSLRKSPKKYSRKPLRKSPKKSLRKHPKKSVRKPVRKSPKKSVKKNLKKPVRKSVKKPVRKSVKYLKSYRKYTSKTSR
jgi:hypothetical protein